MSTVTTMPATTFSHGRFTHGPRIARSLQSSSASTIVDRQDDSRERLHRQDEEPERGVRDEHDAGGDRDQRGEGDVERLRLAKAPIERRAVPGHVAVGIGGCERDRRGTDHRGVQQDDRKEDARGVPDGGSETLGDREPVLEVSEQVRMTAEGERRGRDDQRRGDDGDA